MFLRRIRLTLEMIKFEHSVFALPFALTGALLAIRDGDMLAPGETGMTEYQMHPQYYAHQRAIDSATRLAHQKEAAPTTDGQ